MEKILSEWIPPNGRVISSGGGAAGASIARSVSFKANMSTPAPFKDVVAFYKAKMTALTEELRADAVAARNKEQRDRAADNRQNGIQGLDDLFDGAKKGNSAVTIAHRQKSIADFDQNLSRGTAKIRVLVHQEGSTATTVVISRLADEDETRIVWMHHDGYELAIPDHQPPQEVNRPEE